MNRLYVVEGSPTSDRRLRRPPAGAAQLRDRGLRPRGGGGPRRRRPRAASTHAWVAPDRDGPEARRRQGAGDRRRVAAAGGARARPRDERGAGRGRHDRDLHRARRGRARSARRRPSRPSSARCRRARSRCSSILGSNPAYAAPADLDFAEALDKVPLRIHHGLYLDETAERCHWHLPASHPLESWGDLRAADGTVSIVQPLIAPLYNTLSDDRGPGRRSARAEQKGYDVVRAHWEARARRGRVREALEPRPARRGRGRHRVRAEGGEGRARRRGRRRRRPPAAGGLEIAFRTDPAVYDGRFANLGWLQELPKPLSKITWDNVALVSPKTAAALGGVQTEQTAQRPLHRRRRAAARRPLGEGAALGAARATPTAPSPSTSASAARARARSAPASASTPTRCARATRRGRRAGSRS